MTTQLAFQSSLPRAGSTLFSNIVGQNPAFHVTPTSGLLDLLYVARGQFSRGEEFKAQGREEMERAFIGLDGTGGNSSENHNSKTGKSSLRFRPCCGVSRCCWRCAVWIARGVAATG